MTLFMRTSLLYVSVFMVLGAAMLFLSPWLIERGFTPTEIGYLSAVTILLRLFTGPLLGLALDRARRPELLFAGLSAGLAASYCGFILSEDKFLIVLAVCMTAVFWSATLPAAEAYGVTASEQKGLDYGRMRLWGSVAFIVSGIAMGEISDRWSLDLLPWWLTLFSLLLIGAAYLQRGPVALRDRSRLPHMGDIFILLGTRRFALVALGTGLIQTSHAVFYVFGTVHWQSLDYSDRTIGILWAVGVIAEIALFAVSGRLTERFNVARLAILAGFLGVVRWSVMAIDPPLTAVFFVQAIHGFTFGAVHLAAMRYLGREIAPNLMATGQSLYAALLGVLMGVVIAICGPLYTAFGGATYYAMVVLCLLAIPVLLAARKT